MNGIINHRNMVCERIKKSFSTDLEKGRAVGDIHPTHSNWVWTEYKPGKFDWRTVGGRVHKKTQAVNTSPNNASASASKSKVSDKNKPEQSSKPTNSNKTTPDFSKLKKWSDPFVELFNKPENLKAIAKYIGDVDMNKRMSVSKIGSSDSAAFAFHYITDNGVPYRDEFSFNGKPSPHIGGWNSNDAIAKIYNDNKDSLPPLKEDSDGNVLGVDKSKIVESSSQKKDFFKTSDKEWTEFFAKNRGNITDYLGSYTKINYIRYRGTVSTKDEDGKKFKGVKIDVIYEHDGKRQPTSEIVIDSDGYLRRNIGGFHAVYTAPIKQRHLMPIFKKIFK